MTETFSVQVTHDTTAKSRPRSPAGLLRPALPLRAVGTLDERWRIGKGSAFRGGLVSGAKMVSTITPLPKWSAGAMKLPDGAKTGLVSTFLEADDEAWLLALRWPSDLPAGTTILLGNMTGVSGDGGWGLFFNAAALKISTFGLTTVTRTLTNPAGFTVGNILAVGIALTASSRIVQIRGAAATTDTGGTRVKSATRPIALGEYHYTVGSAHYPVEIFAVERHAAALDAAALDAALEVFAEDCAAQGVPVYGG